MANAAQERKRALAVKPKTDLGATLDKIPDDGDLEVASVEFVERNGKNDENEPETYIVVVMTTPDGGKFHTSSKPVREYLESLVAMVPSPFPCWMKFGKVKSSSNPSRSYWDVIE